MKIAVRKLNNSALLARDSESNSDIVVMGKGISFKYKEQQEISPEDIETVFVLENSERSAEYIGQFEQASQEYVEVTQRIIEKIMARFELAFQEQLFIVLMDHIQFAVQRFRTGIRIENRMVWMIQRMYPAEFELGVEAVDIINTTFSIQLPIEEAGNIAFHIINSMKVCQESTYEQTHSFIELQNDIFSIVKYSLNINFDKRGLIIDRFMTHIQFFVQRLINHEVIEEQNEATLFEKIVEDYPKEFKCSLNIRDYIIKKLGIEITREELIYLTVHLVRLVNQKGK